MVVIDASCIARHTWLSLHECHRGVLLVATHFPDTLAGHVSGCGYRRMA